MSDEIDVFMLLIGDDAVDVEIFRLVERRGGSKPPLVGAEPAEGGENVDEPDVFRRSW